MFVKQSLAESICDCHVASSLPHGLFTAAGAGMRTVRTVRLAAWLIIVGLRHLHLGHGILSIYQLSITEVNGPSTLVYLKGKQTLGGMLAVKTPP